MLAYHVVGEYALEVRIDAADKAGKCADEGKSGLPEETHVAITFCSGEQRRAYIPESEPGQSRAVYTTWTEKRQSDAVQSCAGCFEAKFATDGDAEMSL